MEINEPDQVATRAENLSSLRAVKALVRRSFFLLDNFPGALDLWVGLWSIYNEDAQDDRRPREEYLPQTNEVTHEVKIRNCESQ